MRNWLNLLEDVEIPPFINHVTDELLNEILSTGKWVHHGGDIEDQWDGGCFDWFLGDDSNLIGKSFEEVRRTVEFKNVLRSALQHVANEQYNSLLHGNQYEGIPPLTSTTKLYRGITGNLSPDRLGIYWSQLKTQSLHRFIDENKGGILLVAQVGDVKINWDATIRSRLDLAHGQDEHEIQLVAGSPARATAYRVEFKNGKPVVQSPVYLSRNV